MYERNKYLFFYLTKKHETRTFTLFNVFLRRMKTSKGEIADRLHDQIDINM